MVRRTLSRFPIIASRSAISKPVRILEAENHDPQSAFVPAPARGCIALVMKLSVNGRLLVAYNLYPGKPERQAHTRCPDARNSAGFETHIPRICRLIIGGDLDSEYHPARVPHGLEQEGFRSVLGEGLQAHSHHHRRTPLDIRSRPLTVESGSVIMCTDGSDHDLIQAVLRPERGFATAAGK